MPPVEGGSFGNLKLLGDFANGVSVKHQLNVAFPHMKRLVRIMHDCICSKAECGSAVLTLEPLNTAVFAVLHEIFGLAIGASGIVWGFFNQGLAEAFLSIGVKECLEFDLFLVGEIGEEFLNIHCQYVGTSHRITRGFVRFF